MRISVAAKNGKPNRRVSVRRGARLGAHPTRWALGAKGIWIGRAMAYGLGAMGEAGVAKALQIIHKELDVSMAFCGHTNIQNVDRRILLPGTFPVASATV